MTTTPVGVCPIDIKLVITVDELTECIASQVLLGLGNKPLSEMSTSTQRRYSDAAEAVLNLLNDRITAAFPDSARKPLQSQVCGSATIETTAEPEPYDAEAIWKAVADVRAERNAQYNLGHSRVGMLNGFQRIGGMWRCILEQALHVKFPRGIQPHTVCTMLAALKLWRITANPEFQDSYIDAINYTALAEECYNLQLGEKQIEKK